MKKILFVLLTVFVLINTIMAQNDLEFTTYNMGQEFTCITIDTNNNVWGGTHKSGLFVLDKLNNPEASQFQVINAADGNFNVANYEINALAADELGNLWIGHGGTGGQQYSAGGIERLNINDYIDIQHYSAVRDYVCLNNFPYDENDGCATRHCKSIAIDPNNTVWSAHSLTSITLSWDYYTQPGAFSFKTAGSPTFTPIGGSITSTPEFPFPTNYCYPYQDVDFRVVYAVASDDSEVWVSVSRYTGDNGVNYPARILRYGLDGSYLGDIDYTDTGMPITLGIFNGIYKSPRCQNWLTAGGYGFSVWDNGNWTYMTRDSLSNLFPNQMSFNTNAIWGNRQGSVFMGTDEGILVYDGIGAVDDASSYQLLDTDNYPSMTSDVILSGYSDEDGTQWVATDNGIMSFNINESLPDTPQDELDESALYKLYISNVNNGTLENYDRRILMETSYFAAYDDYDSDSLISIATDGSHSTLLKFVDADYSGKRLEIINSLYEPDTDKYGNLHIVDDSSADSLVVLVEHPTYKNADSPEYIEIGLFDECVQNEPVFSFKLKLEKPPLLLLHGIWSDGGTFNAMKNVLENYYPAFAINAPNYPNDKHFTENISEIIDDKNTLIENCLTNDLSVGKVDLVTHSMGGILSRLYLQSPDYENDINKLITVNTPHSGSQMANYLTDFQYTQVIVDVAGIFEGVGGFEGIDFLTMQDAANDLRVDSEAINTLLNGSTLNANTVPSHAITSVTDGFLGIDSWICTAIEGVNALAGNTPHIADRIIDIVAYLGVSICNLQHILAHSIIHDCPYLEDAEGCFTDIAFGGEDNDQVVALSSQFGGLAEANSTFCIDDNYACDVSHTGVHKKSEVIDRVKFLLDQKPNSSYFTLDGFDPPVLDPPSQLIHHDSENKTADSPPSNIQIMSPIEEDIFSPGETVDIIVEGDTDILTILVGFGNAEIGISGEAKSGNINTFAFTIPEEATGDVHVIATAYNAEGYTNLDTLQLIVNNEQLPVELTSFSAEKDGWHNNISWNTASEVDVDFFELQKSPNADVWEIISKVEAVGNSTNSNDYSTLDETPYPITYYRLRIVDIDGTSKVSDVVSVGREETDGLSINIHPTMVREQTVVHLNAVETGTISFSIHDVTGRQMLQQKYDTSGGVQQFPLSMSELPSGVYFVEVNFNDYKHVQKLIKH